MGDGIEELMDEKAGDYYWSEREDVEQPLEVINSEGVDEEVAKEGGVGYPGF